MTKIKPFQNAGGYTTFENSILDYVMPRCKPNTWKIICVTLRQTIGWEDKKTGKRKISDQISFSQYMEKSGIKNRTTLNNAIQDALDNGYLIRHPDGQSFKYSINREYEFDTGTEIVPVQKSDQKEYGNRTSTGTESVHTKEKLKQSIKQKEVKEILETWARLFPEKPQPRPTTKSLQEKVKVRFKDPHFVETWQEAMKRASESPTCQNESWFDLYFFLHNDQNYQKCYNRWMAWKDKKEYGKQSNNGLHSSGKIQNLMGQRPDETLEEYQERRHKEMENAPPLVEE